MDGRERPHLPITHVRRRLTSLTSDIAGRFCFRLLKVIVMVLGWCPSLRENIEQATCPLLSVRMSKFCPVNNHYLVSNPEVSRSYNEHCEALTRLLKTPPAFEGRGSIALYLSPPVIDGIFRFV